MAQAHTDLNALYQELRVELNELVSAHDTSQDPFRSVQPKVLTSLERRLVVRSTFAAIDAVAYRLKQVALEPKRVGQLTPGERALCIEESYELKEEGEVWVRPARLRFLPNLRFAFAVASKAENLSFALDVSTAGWQALRSGAKVRDRLMHPKTVADLTVSNEEIESVIQAFRWFEEQMVAWFEASTRALAARLVVLGGPVTQEPGGAV